MITSCISAALFPIEQSKVKITFSSTLQLDDRGGQLALFSFKSAQKPRYQTAKFFRAEFPGSHFVSLQFFLRKSKVHLPSPLFVAGSEIVPSINNVQRGFTHARYASGSWLFSAADLGKQMTVYSPLRPCPICHSRLYCKQPKPD